MQKKVTAMYYGGVFVLKPMDSTFCAPVITKRFYLLKCTQFTCIRYPLLNYLHKSNLLVTRRPMDSRI